MEKPIYNGDLYDISYGPSYKFLAVASCGVHKNCPHITVRRKGREDWHLLYVESGSIRAEWQGSTETLEAGDFMIYPPHKPQRYEQMAGICYWVHFSGTAVPEILADAGLKRFGICKNEPRSSLTHHFDRMLYHYATADKLRELACAGDLLSLLIELGSAVKGAGSIADKRLREVIVDMQKRCPEAVDISEYAAILGVSKGRFLHIFKETVDTSPCAYMMQLRLARTADSLLATDHTVAEIAYEAGFRDPLYFSRRFKMQYGISPEGFRKKQGTSAMKKALKRKTGCD